MSDAFEAMASRMYPGMSQGPQEPAKAVAATPAAASPATAATAAPESTEAATEHLSEEASPAEKPEPAPPEELTIEQKLYGDAVSLNSNVDWAEDAAAGAEHYRLEEMPVDLRHPDADAYAAGQAQFREGLLAAGAGPSLAAELWSDAIRAERNPIRTTAAEAAAQLRDRWGPRADAKLAAARELLGKAMAKCPEIRTTLERTRLGNDVNFIVKLSKRAEAISKKAGR